MAISLNMPLRTGPGRKVAGAAEPRLLSSLWLLVSRNRFSALPAWDLSWPSSNRRWQEAKRWNIVGFSIDLQQLSVELKSLALNLMAHAWLFSPPWDNGDRCHKSQRDLYLPRLDDNKGPHCLKKRTIRRPFKNQPIRGLPVLVRALSCSCFNISADLCPDRLKNLTVRVTQVAIMAPMYMIDFAQRAARITSDAAPRSACDCYATLAIEEPGYIF